MMMMNLEKLGALEGYLKEFERDYYKPIRTDGGFGGRNNNYMGYTSRRDRYESLSPKEYLKMIRPYLRDLINNHKPTEELTNDSERGEWKMQLVMQNNCISVKNFEDTRTIYSANKPGKLLRALSQMVPSIGFLILIYKDFNKQ